MQTKRIFGHNGFITIDLDTLSDENRQLLKRMYPEEYQKALKEAADNECSLTINVQIHEESTVEEVSEAFVALTKDLMIQDVLYGKVGIDDWAVRILNRFGDEGETIEDIIEWVKNPEAVRFLQDAGELSRLVYFDFENGLLWDTKELYEKHMAYLKRQQQLISLKEKSEILGSLEQEAQEQITVLAKQEHNKGQNIGE